MQPVLIEFVVGIIHRFLSGCHAGKKLLIVAIS
jgi:hypothetical protein